MGIIDSLRKGIAAFVTDYKVPESHKKGEKFEDFVRNEIFIDKHFALVSRTHNYLSNSKDYVEDSLKPDFTLRDKVTGKEFYLEAKFRSTIYQDKITWCNDKQLYRYKRYAADKPFFLILGFGESPDKLDLVALLPFESARYTGLFLSHARKFEINFDKPVNSKILWNR